MRYAILATLIASSAITTAALAQDGTGHGPPKAQSIIVQPVPSVPTSQQLTKLFQPSSTLASMIK